MSTHRTGDVVNEKSLLMSGESIFHTLRAPGMMGHARCTIFQMAEVTV
jgi:hypothetical protein